MIVTWGSSSASTTFEEADGEQADADDRGRRQGVDEGAPEDQLHVHQPVLHHRVGERERDEGERDVAQPAPWRAAGSRPRAKGIA